MSLADRASRRPEGPLVAITLLWGSTFVVTGDVVRHTPPLEYLLLRFGAATLLLTALYRRQLGGRVWRDGAIIGAMHAVGLLLQVLAQVYTTASKTAFVTCLSTPLVPLIAFLRAGQRPTRAQLVAVALATGGLYLLTYPVGDAHWNTGDLYAAACAVAYGIIIVETARRAPHSRAGALVTVQCGTMAAVFALLLASSLVALALLPDGRVPAVVALERRALVAGPRLLVEVGYMAVVCTVVTFVVQTWAMARMTATGAAVVFALEPVFATLLALAVHGASEWPGPRGVVGAGLILGGVLVAGLRRPGSD